MKNLLKKITYTTISVLLFMYTPYFAQAQMKSLKQQAVIDFIIEDSLLQKQLVEDGVIYFTMCKKEINSSYSVDKNQYTFKVTGKITSVVIPLSNEFTYGNIGIINKDNSRIRPIYNDRFIFEPGDYVQIHLVNKINALTFSGKSSYKFGLLNKIAHCDYHVTNKLFNENIKRNDFDGAFNVAKYQLDSIYNLRLNLLNQSKDKLNQNVYDLCMMDYWGIYNSRLMDKCETLYRLNIQKFEKQARDKFFKLYVQFKEIRFTDLNKLSNSYDYADFLLNKDLKIANFNKNDNQLGTNRLQFKDVFTEIERNYHKSILKDKILLLAFYNPLPNYSSYLDEAAKIVGSNRFGNEISALKQMGVSGTKAYPFELQDETGKTWKLNDFRGKLLIIDFWYTGCMSCPAMAAALKPIISGYKANPKIAFVTISIDGEQWKEYWKKSVLGEKYSSKDEINLIALKGRYDDVIIKNNIVAYPSLVVISKDGNIISVDPPDPRFNSKAFNDLLNLNL